jgi:hypothetical protein
MKKIDAIHVRWFVIGAIYEHSKGMRYPLSDEELELYLGAMLPVIMNYLNGTGSLDGQREFTCDVAIQSSICFKGHV